MDYIKLAEEKIASGSTRDEAIEFVKTTSNQLMLDDGVNETQAEMHSFQVVDNLNKHFDVMLERIALPKALKEEEIQLIPAKPKNERLSICQSCDYIKKPESLLKYCNICMCSLEMKTRIDGARCPLGKW